MGFLRDLGAAATIGISATTKQKNAEAEFHQQQERYKKRADRFTQAAANSCTRFEELNGAWEEAKAGIIQSGALTVDPQGNLSWGWFQPADLPADPSAPVDTAKTVSGALPGMVTLIGAPATAWTLVGLFGAAGTGVAISSLSGAAFTTATAAWFGRLGIAGATGLGMRAAPAVLGGIGLVVSLPIQVAVGAKVAGNRERKAISQISETSRVIRLRYSILNEIQPRIEELGNEARDQNLRLLRANAELQAILNLYEQGSEQAKDSINEILQMLVQSRELCSRMKQTMEDNENRFRDNPFPKFD